MTGLNILLLTTSNSAHLSDVVLQQLQHEEGVAAVGEHGVAGDDVGRGPRHPLQDEALPLHRALVARPAPETFERHETGVPHSHGLVDHTTSPRPHLGSGTTLHHQLSTWLSFRENVKQCC